LTASAATESATSRPWRSTTKSSGRALDDEEQRQGKREGDRDERPRREPDDELAEVAPDLAAVRVAEHRRDDALPREREEPGAAGDHDEAQPRRVDDVAGGLVALQAAARERRRGHDRERRRGHAHERGGDQVRVGERRHVADVEVGGEPDGRQVHALHREGGRRALGERREPT
jgi:hypothetical protein